MAIKNITFVEANVTCMNIAAMFQLYSPEEMIFGYSFANLSFQLPWQPIKLNGLDRIHLFGRGLLKEHFCKTFVKISVVG